MTIQPDREVLRAMPRAKRESEARGVMLRYHVERMRAIRRMRHLMLQSPAGTEERCRYEAILAVLRRGGTWPG